jgi:hypothetical protein
MAKKVNAIPQYIVPEISLEVPKQLGAVADKLFTVKNARLDAEKHVAALHALEVALKNHLIDNLPKSQAEGVTGKLINATISKRVIPHVDDVDKFRAYCVRKNSDLIKVTYTPVMDAVRARWDDNIEIPGLSKFNVISVSLTKPRR